MKETAVEWLIEKLSYTTSDGTIISHHFIINKLVEQAKEMEKKNKLLFGKKVADHWGMVNVPLENIEQYYNETFKSE